MTPPPRPSSRSRGLCWAVDLGLQCIAISSGNPARVGGGAGEGEERERGGGGGGGGEERD